MAQVRTQQVPLVRELVLRLRVPAVLLTAVRVVAQAQMQEQQKQVQQRTQQPELRQQQVLVEARMLPRAAAVLAAVPETPTVLAARARTLAQMQMHAEAQVRVPATAALLEAVPAQ